MYFNPNFNLDYSRRFISFVPHCFEIGFRNDRISFELYKLTVKTIFSALYPYQFARKWTGRKIDCGGNIVAPGFIDLQINGAFGLDFSCDVTDKGKMT